MRKLLAATAAVCAALLVAAPVGAGEEEDQAIADEVVAETADLVPDGWEEDPRSEDAEEVEPPPECEDLTQTVEDAQEGPFAEITYGDPADPVGLTEAGSSVYVFSKKKDAKRFANALTSDDAAACQETFGQFLGPEAEVSVEELEFNAAAGFSTTAQAEGDVFVVESLRARVGRGVVTVSTFSQNEPLPFVEDMIAALEESLEDAL